MLIRVQDLQIGDEVIISGNSNLKYLKILSVPKISDVKAYERIIDPTTNKLIWTKTKIKYKTLKVSLRQDVEKYTDNSGRQQEVKSYVFEQDVEKHNRVCYMDLNRRDIFLIKSNKL